MKNKICTKCKVPKLLNEFCHHKQTKDGLQSWCKGCKVVAMGEYYKKNPWKEIFQGIRYRCNNPICKAYKWYGGRGIKCLITVEEVKKLWFRDKACLMKKPSIDRKDNNDDYKYSNCRFIERAENSARQDQITKEKPVNQYNLQGNFIKTWKSQAEIQRVLGFHQSYISSACSGKQKTAYNFIWKFKKDCI